MKNVLFKILIYFLIVFFAVNLGFAAIQVPALFLTMKLAGVPALTARLVTVGVMAALAAVYAVWSVRARFYRARSLTGVICFTLTAVGVLCAKLLLV